MGRLKWFDRFLTNEIVAQNQFLRRRQRKNRFLRPIKEITSTMGLSPEHLHSKNLTTTQHTPMSGPPWEQNINWPPAETEQCQRRNLSFCIFYTNTAHVHKNTYVPVFFIWG